MTTSALPQDADQRSHARRDVLLAGRLRHGEAWLACEVVNLSAGGAKLRTQGADWRPDSLLGSLSDSRPNSRPGSQPNSQPNSRSGSQPDSQPEGDTPAAEGLPACAGVAFTPGQELALELAPCGLLPGVVAWVRPGELGLRFTGDPARLAEALIGLATYG